MGLEYLVHQKQCRRLVKKKRRTIWVNPKILEGIPDAVLDVERVSKDGYVEFREVKKK